MTRAVSDSVEKKQDNKFIHGATIASIIWLVVALLGARWKWPSNGDLKPNELGDIAAGIAAPLAFLWLWVATHLQRNELSLQRQELCETRTVMAEQKEEQRKAAEASDRLASIYEEMKKLEKKSQQINLYKSYSEAFIRYCNNTKDIELKYNGNLEVINLKDNSILCILDEFIEIKNRNKEPLRELMNEKEFDKIERMHLILLCFKKEIEENIMLDTLFAAEYYDALRHTLEEIIK